MGIEVAVCGATVCELAAVRRLFDEWDRVFSRFRPESELSRLNRDASEVVVVSRVFAYYRPEWRGEAAGPAMIVNRR